MFNKSGKAQHAQRASIAGASAAQPLSPEALTAQKLIAESPSPISTPHTLAESRLPPCRLLAGSRTGTAVNISVDATARAVEYRECHDMRTDQADACGMADRSGSAHEPSEASADQGNGRTGQCSSRGNYCSVTSIHFFGRKQRFKGSYATKWLSLDVHAQACASKLHPLCAVVVFLPRRSCKPLSYALCCKMPLAVQCTVVFSAEAEAPCGIREPPKHICAAAGALCHVP